MLKEDITAYLLEYIREKFEVPADDVDLTPEVNLFDYGYIDSFGSVEIYAHLEQEYGVSITPENLLRTPLRSVNQMALFVLENQ